MLPIIPIAVAGVVGAAGALLLSPHSGKENREIAADKLKVNAARDFISEHVPGKGVKADAAQEGEVESVEIESEKALEAPKSGDAGGTDDSAGE